LRFRDDRLQMLLVLKALGVAALAQQRQVDGEDPQPVIQVQPELSFRRPEIQVAVGGVSELASGECGFRTAHPNQ